MRLCPDEKGVNIGKQQKMTRDYRALGLMSGTSLDGVDVAMIETDGLAEVRPLGFLFCPYEESFRDHVRACFGKSEGTKDPMVREVETELTRLHAEAVLDFLEQEDLSAEDIDLIGFHGQTIWHNPAARETVQIGDGTLLARMTDIDVVNDFRTADVMAGGQGAPLVPLYHRALAAGLEKPVAIINIGGVSNITWIGGESDDEILAFDLGTGNALIDDWMFKHTGQNCDRDGVCAVRGAVDEAHVAKFLAHPFFQVKPPKSLDRDAFAGFVPEGASVEAGAATLTMMTVAAIAKGLEAVPTLPREVYIAGGGRHNATMMRWLAEWTGLSIQSVDALGWNGDAIEAEAFAYLAVHSVLGLPLSVPNTTRVPQPMTGGVLSKRS